MLLQHLETFLTQEGWPIHGVVESSFADEVGILSAYRGENETFNCFGLVFETDRRIAFYATCPLDFSISQLPRMAEFLHRANFDMVIGNFELNFDKQEIRFKTSIDIEGIEINQELLAGVIFPAVMTMDLYLPLIKKIIQSSESPAAILAEVS